MKHINLEELEEFAKNHTVTDIRKVYGENGYRLCRKYHFNYMYKKYQYADQSYAIKKQRIMDDIKNDMPLSYIATIYNCSRQYIFQVKKEMEEM